MEFRSSETNRGKKSLIYDGFTFRIDRTLKSGDISWRCTIKACKGRIKTDEHSTVILNGNCDHQHESDARKLERQIIRVVVKKKATEDITARPMKLVRCELMNIEEETLIEKDLKSLTMAIYRERRKEYPTLPKSRDDVHNTMDVLELKSNKKEPFCLMNSKEHGIVILSCNSNLDALCTKASELFIDGTFSYCPKYFEQLYTFHGFKLGHYVPLVFALLPSKSEEIYTVLLNMISSLCTDRNIMFKPRIVHIDFEIAMHNAFRSVFPDTRIECCRFHLGQSWWRKIQKLGLSVEYKNKECEVGLWLTKFFGLAFLDPTTVGDCFAEDMYEDIPNDPRCVKFADYLVETYIAPESLFPPRLWASLPSSESRRTTNGPESFHAHYNEQFYSAHPCIFVFLDTILKLQTTTYIKLRGLDTAAVVRRSEKEKTDYLMEQFRKYQDGEVNRLSFLKDFGFKFSARTDM